MRNNDKNNNVLILKTSDIAYAMDRESDMKCIRFGHWIIRYSGLFRISIFDIRTLSEYNFQTGNMQNVILHLSNQTV
jgi:hypothetical protein